MRWFCTTLLWVLNFACVTKDKLDECRYKSIFSSGHYGSQFFGTTMSAKMPTGNESDNRSLIRNVARGGLMTPKKFTSICFYKKTILICVTS